jgi:hypothetical protein
MRQNLERLKYATLAPSRYLVYLTQAEHARLEGIIPRLQAEAARALDEELARLNRPSWWRALAARAGWEPAPARPAAENAAGRWHVEFLPDHDGELEADGDIIVHSDLVLPPDLDLGVGERTRRITTSRIAGVTTTREVGTGLPPGQRTPGTGGDGSPTETRPSPQGRQAFARLTFRDNRGDQEHLIVRDETTIGRGGQAYPVDVRVATSEDVSREHARLRRDASTGQFFLIDLSRLGTSVDGRHVPRGVEERDGVRRENGMQTALPARARIGLAETVFVEFEQITR